MRKSKPNGRLTRARRHVAPDSQHSWRHYVGFIRDLVKAGSVRFVEPLLNTLVSFSLPRRVVMVLETRSIWYAVQYVESNYPSGAF